MKNSLLKTKSYINGQWLDSKETYEVSNPANNELIAKVSKAGSQETQMAIEAAENAFYFWAKETAKSRSKILRRWSELMLENKESLAHLVTSEQGKLLAEAQGKVVYAANLEWFSEEAKCSYGDIVPSHMPNYQILVTKEPVGVVDAITPCNFTLGHDYS